MGPALDSSPTTSSDRNSADYSHNSVHMKLSHEGMDREPKNPSRAQAELPHAITPGNSVEVTELPVTEMPATLPKVQLVYTSERDPKAPTVAFLDWFEEKRRIASSVNASHGELSLKAAEHNGFNTIALEIGAKPTEESLNAVLDKMNSGEIHLGRGDVLNLSLHDHAEPTFSTISEYLGFSVNRENLASEREHILTRLDEIALDPHRSKFDRDWACYVLGTNNAISAIRSKGVEVIHSAGNYGPERFDYSFLTADHTLASFAPNGHRDSFSAVNSLTEVGNGVYPIFAVPDVSLYSPEPISRQEGSAEIGETGVIFPRTNTVQLPDQPIQFDRYKILPGSTISAQDKEFNALALSSISNQSNYSQYFDIENNRNLPPYQLAATRDTTVVPVNVIRTNQFPISQKTVIGTIQGTSFSNIDYLKNNFERLRQKKAEAQAP